MSDTSPEAASAREASSVASGESWPGSAPGDAVPGAYPTGQSVPRRPSRRVRAPLIGFVAGALAVAVGWGGYQLIHSGTTNRASTPVATSSQSTSGGITVAGHGIQLTFPAGWVNVPTSPNQAQQFIKDFEGKYRHLPAAVRNEVDSPQILSSLAMFVFRINAQGASQENLNALVAPGALAPSQMVAQLKSGQGPAQFGATDVHYSVTNFARFPGVIVTYVLRAQGITLYGAQSYLEGPANTVVTTVTSHAAATSEADLRRIVDTIRFT